MRASSDAVVMGIFPSSALFVGSWAPPQAINPRTDMPMIAHAVTLFLNTMSPFGLRAQISVFEALNLRRRAANGAQRELRFCCVFILAKTSTV